MCGDLLNQLFACRAIHGSYIKGACDPNCVRGIRECGLCCDNGAGTVLSGMGRNEQNGKDTGTGNEVMDEPTQLIFPLLCGVL